MPLNYASFPGYKMSRGKISGNQHMGEKYRRKYDNYYLKITRDQGLAEEFYIV